MVPSIDFQINNLQNLGLKAANRGLWSPISFSGVLYLILRNRFEKEISSFEPDLKKDFHEELDQ
ncbi:MAG: hypothetical protein HQK66_01735 [Desulfamplus sp.]|nr:hypothetical protein [Desulfamplus sp.]